MENKFVFTNIEGRLEGMAEGRAEGMAEGRAEGMAEGRAAVAFSMLEGGMPMEQIVKFTGLSVAEIQALRKVQ